MASHRKALAIKPGYAKVWNNLKFAARALQFSKAGGNGVAQASASEFDDAPRTNVGYAMHQFYLAGFRPHEAGECFEKIIAGLPPMAEQTIPIDGASHMADRAHIDPAQFKRSGSYQLLRAGMHDRWDVQTELGTYPHMLEPLSSL